jgi:HEAT repeat protein
MPRRAHLLALCLCLPCGACAKSDAQWVHELEDRDPYVRGLAAIGLSLQSPRSARPALPVLLETIDRPGVGLGKEAAHVLSLVGVHEVEPLLAALVEDELMSEHRRGAILNALVATGPAAAGPVVRCLQGPGRELAGDLGDVLLAIGEPALPSIVALLATEDDFALQNFAAFLLGKLGPRARAGAPALERALASPDAGVRSAAQAALRSLGGSSPAPVVPR